MAKPTIIQRLKTAFTTQKSLSSSGIVARNFSRNSEFAPYRQVTGITYKAIDKIGQSLSTYKMQVQRPNGKTYENHPILALQLRPNPNQNASDFTHLYGMMFEIYGESFWYLATGERSGKVKEVYLLNPSQVELKVTGGELLGYMYHKSNGETLALLPEEVIHDKRPNPFNEWRGMSVLEKAAVYVDTEVSTANFTLNYIRNNATPSGIVTMPNMDKEAFKQFAMQWRESYEGPENAGKTAFIRATAEGQEVKFQAVGATLKDIDQKITRDMAKEDVLMMFDVPKPLLGMADESGLGRGNVESLKYIFADSKIEPMMERLDNIWQQIADRNRGSDGSVIITHASAIPEDKEYNLTKNTKGVNVWLTVNEVRAQEGLDPIKDGDVINPDNKAVQTNTKTLKIVAKTKLSKSEQIKKVNEAQEEFRSKLIDTNDIYVVKVKREISRFADKQEAQVIDKISATNKAYEEWLPTIKEESVALAAAVMPVLVELMEAQAEDVTNFITGELITISPEMRKLVEANILKVAGVYNQDTIAALEKTLLQGQLEGESLAKLKKRVESVYADAKGYRAERIARTESLKTSNMTAEEVYRENGYTEVEWFINPGACEFCRTYAGRTKSVGSNFTNLGDVITGDSGGQMRVEYADISTPPLHPNCTCSLVPVR